MLLTKHTLKLNLYKKKTNYLNSNSTLNCTLLNRIKMYYIKNFNKLVFLAVLVQNINTCYSHLYSIKINLNKRRINAKSTMLVGISNPSTLILNFKKSRFFPSLTNLKGRLFSTMSLGMFAKFFKKQKSFLRNKAVFLLIASFIRKLILFSEMKEAILLVKRVPLYFKEILSTLYDPVVSLYDNPFNGRETNENKLKNSFKFTTFMFFTNKPYGEFKNKKKGRLKRKITKRLISMNRMVD